MVLRACLHVFVTLLGCSWGVTGRIPSGLPGSVSTSPPTCLGDLAFLNDGESNLQFCTPDKFIEIEFKLKFGCIYQNPEYIIDQGIRLEVGERTSDTTTWSPVRFYTANLTMPTNYTSFVTLDYSNQSVTADAHRYSSSLSLKLVDAGKPLVLREYLCGRFVDILTRGSMLRLRWMQRYGERATRNQAPWILDDISVKLWNGSCFTEIMDEDFEGQMRTAGIAAGEVEVPECDSPGGGSALSFRQAVSTATTRRSLIFDFHGQELEECNGNGTASMGNSDQLQSCQVEAESNNTVNITCSAGSFVVCSCEGSAINGTRCEMIPTTAEATTMATTATTAESTTTVMTFTETTTPSPAVVRMTLEVFEKNVTEESIADVVSLFPPGGVPKEVTEVVISATTNSLKATSVESDPSAGGRILNSLDLFALRGYNSSLGQVTNDLYSFDVEDFEEEALMELDDASLIEGIHNSLGGIDIPGELFHEFAAESFRLASFIYKNLSGILPSESEDGKNSTISSPVISASLGCGVESCQTGNLSLEHPVIIKIHHFKSSEGELPTCQFFDLEKNVWSTHGCKRIAALSNSTYSTCECKHLTHFAILLSPGLTIDATNAFSLEIIGYVGVSISVLCMIATIFILTFLKPLRGMRTYIHINLCICLGIAQIFFIVAIDKTGIEELCQAIAVILHYLFLVTFMWMLMEGVVLYVVLIRVFIKKQRLYILGFTLASYGLPALYLCLTVPVGLAYRDSEGMPQYGPSNVSETCWLRYDTHFVWAFISPVILIILINIGFFMMAITIMCKHEKRGTDKSKLETVRNWLKTSISLMVVMGITWIIGVLVFHQALLFVAYIFTIVTAFQGAIIFLLFVVMSKQVRDHYGSWWRSKKGESEVLSKLFPSSTDGRSRANSFFSRTASRASSSFFSRSMTTFRSTLPDDETDVKLTDIKEADSNGQQVQQANWVCIVDMKPTEESKEEEEEKQTESQDNIKVPVGELELSVFFEDHNSHADVDTGSGRCETIEMCDEVRRPNSRVISEGVAPESSISEDMVPEPSISEAGRDQGTAHSVTYEGQKPNGTAMGSRDHMTQCGSGNTTGDSMNSVDDVDSHLADATTIS